MPSAVALEVKGVHVAFPGSSAWALVGVWFRVPCGASAALVGANGAGKSTLLKTLAGILPPSQGSVTVLGREGGACHHQISYLPQRSEIDWEFPVSLRRLVVSGRYLHLGWFRSPSRDDWKKADAVIEELGLSGLCNRQIGELSGGQQQRGLLARCLVQESPILLLDEPLNAIDAETVGIIDRVLSHQKKLGKTVVMATHDLERLETGFDGALFLHQGQEVAPTHGYFYPLVLGRDAFGDAHA